MARTRSAKSRARPAGRPAAAFGFLSLVFAIALSRGRLRLPPDPACTFVVRKCLQVHTSDGPTTLLKCATNWLFLHAFSASPVHFLLLVLLIGYGDLISPT